MCEHAGTCTHTHRLAHLVSAAPFLRIIFVKEWRDLCGFLSQTPCFPHIIRPFPYFPISFHPLYSFLRVFSVSLSMAECKVRSTKGTPGKHGCGPAFFSLWHQPAPSPPSLPRWLPFHRSIRKNGKQGFQQKEEGGRGGGYPHHHLHLSFPSSLSQLAFHTPGSTIQTRSCMYMSFSANNASFLTPLLPLRFYRSISVQIRQGKVRMRACSLKKET